MLRIFQFMFFLAFFFSIYFGLNGYVIIRLSTLFGITRNYIFYIIVVLITMSFILSTSLVRMSFNWFTRAFYMISSLWMGVVFLLFSTLIIYEIVRLFIKIKPQTAGIAIILIVVVITIIGFINAQMVNTKVVELPEFSEKLRVVQLTDVHVGTIHNSGFLKMIVEKVNAAKPDIVVLTGDLVSGGSKLREDMFHELKDIKAPTYYVNGNHEHYDGLEEVERLLKKANVESLNDKAIDFKGVQIIGIDYIEMREGNPKITYAEKFSKLELDPKKPSIMLQHIPLRKDEYPDVDLILSGHTHAGQIFPFNYFTMLLSTPYVHGLYQLNHGKIYVGPGTGTWGPMIRLGSRNEITVFELGK